ncbi:MAG: bifunctional UDP-N-acetylglucosamine diphosphorylase/glucosamine-1-phosphate N-acetyltransferase GlmU [Acidobacteria bacterium]|nr:bifunctional UDP-N-acetylglucosamine diphosphorylase/glucosamine-1-phosphate N-acetyltransferase GlmU [Acidobacteriota bacterium]
MSKNLYTLIMAAGKGTRMKSALPKVLHKVNGKPVIDYVISASSPFKPEFITLILGHGREMVEKELPSFLPADSPKISFVTQAEQRGTGDAVASAADIFKGKKGDLLILSGDTPLLTAEILREFYKDYKNSGNELSVFTMELDDPTGYGRIVTDNDGHITAIVEHRDADSETLKIKEVNAGIYIGDVQKIFSFLDKLGTDNDQGEYYLPDLVKVFIEENLPVGRFIWPHSSDLMGINTRKELAMADKYLRMRKLDALMDSGVTIYDPDTTYIEEQVMIEPDVTIFPGAVITGKTEIGSGTVIQHYCKIHNVKIGNNTVINSFSHLEDSIIGDECAIGPYARLRPGNKLANKVKIGNFVEAKKTEIGNGSKASHLTYLGDAIIGEGVNIGAGTITCNYDGWLKHKTVIEDGVFVGSNTEIVAPAVIGKGAVIGAGTTVTDDVPQDALAVSRVDQKNIDGWAAKKRKKMNEQVKK